MSRVPRIITVLVDTREQKPLLFPTTLKYYADVSAGSRRVLQVKTLKKTLDSGDYALALDETGARMQRRLGGPDESKIETKRGLDELRQNAFEARARVQASLQRLVDSCHYPYLVLEGSISQMLTPTKHSPFPGWVMDEFLRMISATPIRLILTGSCRTNAARRRVGEFCLRLMLSHAFPGGGFDANVE